MAALAALYAALASLSIVPGLVGLTWLRVHLIALGFVVQALFGVLPGVVARGAGQSPPKLRLDVWATMNVGLLALLIGIPIINAPDLAIFV